MKKMDGIQILFELIIELCKLITGNNIEPSSPKPLSLALRQEVRKLDQTLKEYKLLCENQIDSAQELVSFIEKKSTDISALESERQKIYNRIRRPKSPEDENQNKESRKAISKQMKPVRERLRRAEKILEKPPHLYELLKQEHELERKARARYLDRSR